MVRFGKVFSFTLGDSAMHSIVDQRLEAISREWILFDEEIHTRACYEATSR